MRLGNRFELSHKHQYSIHWMLYSKSLVTLSDQAAYCSNKYNYWWLQPWERNYEQSVLLNRFIWWYMLIQGLSNHCNDGDNIRRVREEAASGCSQNYGEILYGENRYEEKKIVNGIIILHLGSLNEESCRTMFHSALVRPHPSSQFGQIEPHYVS